MKDFGNWLNDLTEGLRDPTPSDEAVVTQREAPPNPSIYAKRRA